MDYDADVRAETRGRRDLAAKFAELRKHGAFGGAATVLGQPHQDMAFGCFEPEGDEPAGVDSLIWTGSITKTFVAAALLRLVDQGVVSLRQSVHDFLPGVFPRGHEITLRHLLQHTSGIVTWEHAFDDRPPPADRAVLSPHEILELSAGLRPVIEPGTRWLPSNTNYVAVGLVLEALVGERLGDTLKRLLFDPLELRTTRFVDPDALDWSQSESQLFKKYRLAQSHYGVNWPYGAGATVSSLRDIVRFYATLLGGRVLTSRTREEMMTTVPIEVRAIPRRYGLGIGEVDVGCGSAWGQAGTGVGQFTWVLSAPDGRTVAGATAQFGSDADYSRRPLGYAVFMAFLRRMYCNSLSGVETI